MVEAAKGWCKRLTHQSASVLTSDIKTVSKFGFGHGIFPPEGRALFCLWRCLNVFDSFSLL
uniref:Uncharacterized protein n=1 Tax=Romanomermis culicivorax TaxID=13658 RepID=A0A915KLF3_ROMCU